MGLWEVREWQGDRSRVYDAVRSREYRFMIQMLKDQVSSSSTNRPSSADKK